ncbi:MAG: alpha/beta fold hydrolase [Planctomycetes bacterium]|nr:alpha/beta fold hydrolase [Planctomycetota bacterium]
MHPQQVIFKNKGTALVGSLYMPCEAAGDVPGVIFLHGFTGHRIEPGFLFPRAARSLERKGIASLTFDFAGSGESDGDFSDMTILGEVADAHAAAEHLKKAPGICARKLGVIGYSLGAAVACQLLGERDDLAAAALWAPAVQVRDLTEARLAEAGLTLDTIPSSGIPVGNLMTGHEFYRQIPHLDPVSACMRSGAAILAVHGSNDTVVPATHGRQLAETLGAREAESEYVELAEVGHGFEKVDMAEKLIELTSTWFERHLKG